MDIKQINDPWYVGLAEKYGASFAELAGYFEEDLPYTTQYSDFYDLPQNTTVVQFSGAFYPFHEGHWKNIEDAVNVLSKDTSNGIAIIHADHNSYRASKGSVCEKMVNDSLHQNRSPLPNGWSVLVVDENDIPNNCSRNFTRLYEELESLGNRVVFICGGDRANFALTFVESGECLVVGRSDHPNFEEFKQRLQQNERIGFVERVDGFSSSNIRKSFK